jgi:hypothetical protein
MTVAAVIPIWGDYVRFWPRAWSELCRQVETGARVSEVVVARPAGSEPSLERLRDAFEAVLGREVPELIECPLPEPTPPLGVALNQGLDRVSSRLVSFLGVDNYYAPGIWRLLTAQHDRWPKLGSAAAGLVKRLPDGTIASPGARAHRLRRPRRFDPGGAWQQALLWRLSIEAAVLGTAGSVHAAQVLRASGGHGSAAMEDMILGAASISCAPGCYLPRLLGVVWVRRPGSVWSASHPRGEILAAHDEMAERLHRLNELRRLRPSLARTWRLAQSALAVQRRRLLRTIPLDGLRPGVGPPPRYPVPRPDRRLTVWLEGASRDERRMSELLAMASS